MPRPPQMLWIGTSARRNALRMLSPGSAATGIPFFRMIIEAPPYDIAGGPYR